jgi:hypothetical protein
MTKTTSIEALREEWGEKYESKVEAAKAVVHKHPALIDALEESGLGDDPRMIRFFAELGEEMGAGGAKDDDAGERMSPEAAKQAIEKMLKDEEHPYHDKRKPGHKEAVKKAGRWYDAAYPQGSLE